MIIWLTAHTGVRITFISEWRTLKYFSILGGFFSQIKVLLCVTEMFPVILFWDFAKIDQFELLVTGYNPGHSTLAKIMSRHLVSKNTEKGGDFWLPAQTLKCGKIGILFHNKLCNISHMGLGFFFSGHNKGKIVFRLFFRLSALTAGALCVMTYKL